MARREDRKDKPVRQPKERPLSPSEKKEASSVSPKSKKQVGLSRSEKEQLVLKIRKMMWDSFGHEDR